MSSNFNNINYFIIGSKCWYLKIEVNNISADKINKKPLVYRKQWQIKSNSEDIFLKWIEFDLIGKGLTIFSRLSYKEKNKTIIFSIAIALLMTVTGNSSSTYTLAMSIANNTT